MFLICKAGVTSMLSWSVFSLLLCIESYLMVDFGAFWNRKLQPLLGVNWIFLGQALPLGMCWRLGSSMSVMLNLLPLVFWFQLVTMKWVPPHRSLWPTNRRRTLLGWVLSSAAELFCMHFLLSMTQYLDYCAVFRYLQGKSLPLWLKTTIRRILWLVSGKKILTQTIWSPWSAVWNQGALSKSGILWSHCWQGQKFSL